MCGGDIDPCIGKARPSDDRKVPHVDDKSTRGPVKIGKRLETGELLPLGTLPVVHMKEVELVAPLACHCSDNRAVHSAADEYDRAIPT